MTHIGRFNRSPATRVALAPLLMGLRWQFPRPRNPASWSWSCRNLRGSAGSLSADPVCCDNCSRTGGRVRSKAQHWKCCTAARLSWVQIPTRPLLSCLKTSRQSRRRGRDPNYLFRLVWRFPCKRHIHGAGPAICIPDHCVRRQRGRYRRQPRLPLEGPTPSRDRRSGTGCPRPRSGGSWRRCGGSRRRRRGGRDRRGALEPEEPVTAALLS